MIVWVAGVGGDQRLHGYNGDTGAVVYAGGGANELMTGTRQWNTGMVARGRIYFGADNKVYAFQAARRNTYAYTYRYCHSHCDTYSYGNEQQRRPRQLRRQRPRQQLLLRRLRQRYRLVRHLRQPPHQCQRRLLHRR